MLTINGLITLTNNEQTIYYNVFLMLVNSWFMLAQVY